MALTIRHGTADGFLADKPKADPPPGGAGGHPSSAPAARRLMAEAAAAASGTAYSGVQVSDWWGPSGVSSSLIDVWHRPSGGTVAKAVVAPGEDGQSTAAGSGDPVVAMTITGRQLELLLANYEVKYAGPGSAAGRPAQVIVVRRPGGRLVARFWLDSQTKLPLRREVYDSRSHLISSISLTDLKFGAQALASEPAAVAHPWTQQLGARAVGALRKQGWPVPARLDGALRLYSVTKSYDGADQVIDLSYSDGLSVISLFIQHGKLPAAMPGWQRVAIGGHHAYTSDPDNRAVSWSSGGFVCTMIADAPAGTVDQAVASLAGNHGPGFWSRMDRGFARLVTLANLFR